MAWAEKGAKGFRGRYRDRERNIHDVRDAEGKIIHFAKKKDAKEAALDKEAEIRAGTWWNPTLGAITFSAYFENHWRPNKVVEVNTIAKYDTFYECRHWSLKGYWGEVELRHITQTAVQAWVAQMVRSGDLTPRSIEDRFKHFQTIIAGGTVGTRRRGTSALREGLIARNPCIGIELPTVPKPEKKIYTPGQVDLVLDAMPEWYRPIPLFLSQTGVRWGELLGLQVDDFMLGFRSFIVNRTIIEPGSKYTGNGTPFMVKEYPKGKKRRRVSLSRDAATCVQQLIRDRELGPGDRIFTVQDGTGHGKKDSGTGLPKRTETFPEGHPIGRSNFSSKVWRPAIEKAGVPYRKVHQLRASNISWLLAGGMPLTDVMELVGHEQFATTQLYATAMAEDKYDDVMSALDVVRAKFG